ncbi:glycoside hydrolase family 72 protein [Babjeviella inositovora NRRL Y-12698]|uniref:1,3-beta-glucanosyltransferase n=1 Tax=Babjeviella inositovora NRRL Y-12698 TaxID=984486 RepID=A0A1E3QWB8_9ASCO|nr:glycoside hydrolase family 72 protein [Babjeviella inositovora NRRL Y-12698]ODQ81973.1 glycoside hydrolase family 72 protein [Babjeviella inositovora NRRL Y-12698]
MYPLYSSWTSFIVVACLIQGLYASIHPITIHGQKFIDSITKETFLIKGVDYQPGGSSAVTANFDPLSDPNTCARDIILFQELGINTIRVYSVNPDLNHDICMTLLASAGIYVVIDVNSPLENQHLNRYEPWTTYNEFYLEHVFKVVEQFSFYNNTLGLFAGNEIINDRKSARESPVYTKALIRDIKTYIAYNSPRSIPVGYSAADDLNYRMPLSQYLECAEDDPFVSVDFYGVNSYQWCGEQTFYTSGYNVLVEDYAKFTKPVFFSEFGCNEVTPRLFEEVKAIFSEDMVGVFSGGLVYEYSQEANNYGLVDIDASGNVQMLEDFEALRNQLEMVEDKPFTKTKHSPHRNIPMCEETYKNLDVSKGLPKSLAEDLILDGVSVERGNFVDLEVSNLFTKYKIFYPDGSRYPEDIGVEIVQDLSSVDISASEKPRKKTHMLMGLFNSRASTSMSITAMHLVVAVISIMASIAA